MSERTGKTLFLVSAAGFGLLLLAAFAELPPFGRYKGPYGDLINDKVRAQRHCPQSVAAITFDYRGFDTMGEEFILFTAVLGILVLMRRQRTEEEDRPRDQAEDRRPPALNEAVTLLGTMLFPLAFLFAVYIVLHGHLTPGGGFQGGALGASAFLYLYLSGEYENFVRMVPEWLMDLLEASGAAGFVVVGLLGLFALAAFMQNVLPYGKEGQLLSAGFLPVLNGVVGLEVCAGFILVLTEFLHQALEIHRRRRK